MPWSSTMNSMPFLPSMSLTLELEVRGVNLFMQLLFFSLCSSGFRSSLSLRRYSELARLFLRPGAQLERPAAASAHRHGEERWDPTRRGQPVGSEELPLLPPVHLTYLPPEALGGHTESPGAATQLRPGAAPAGGKLTLMTRVVLWVFICRTQVEYQNKSCWHSGLNNITLLQPFCSVIYSYEHKNAILSGVSHSFRVIKMQ